VRIVVVAKLVMYQGRDGPSAITRQLVDGCGLAMVLGRLFLVVKGLVSGCIAVMVHQ
jgi:hypothetical protein